MKAADTIGMYFLLVLVMSPVQGKIDDSSHLIKIEREFHDFESEIVDLRDLPIIARKGGKGLKEFWCDLYKYRYFKEHTTK